MIQTRKATKRTKKTTTANRKRSTSLISWRGRLLFGKCVPCSPLQKTIIEDDFEAFVCALDLYESAGVALWPDAGIYQRAVLLDHANMLDELIRRSGVGIPIHSEKARSPNANTKESEEERVYLGLKVGGKRRSDAVLQKLAGRKAITYNYDLLRGAISSGATKVVKYLAGPRPLAAYRYYSVTHSDDIAQFLKSVDNLEAALPDLLGWQLDEPNESPLLCAVINDKLDILKQLFALKPNLMEEVLHQRYGS
jgi:hypothetical protein